MKRIKSVAGLMVLSGLCLCAFAASNASAMTLHECTEPVAGKSTTTEFTAAGCATKGKGNFRTTPIEGKKQVFPTLTETTCTPTTCTEGEISGVHAVLHVTIGGASFQITCKEIASSNSFVENKEIEEEKVKKMVFEGTGSTEFLKCEVVGTFKGICTVPETLKTEPLTQTIVQNATEMKVVFKPTKAGGNFILFTISGASCPAALKGEKAVSGEARGTVTEAEPQSISFNSTSGNNLKLGELAAQFTAKIHFGTTVGGTALSAETP
jgi:hypothetical protein